MKKKIFASVIASMLSLVTVMGVSAQNVPMVRAGEREIVMDVAGEYVDGVFMAPVRRICSIAEARCDWYDKERMIILNTKNNVTRIFLYPERNTFRIFTFTSVADGYGEDIELEVPLKIVNDRTLVPFEQIAKALKLEYEWSEDKSVITVKTDEVITDDKKLEAYIVADKEDIAAGEEVTVSLMVNNVDLYPDYGYSGYTAAVIYNSEEFQLVSSHMTTPEGEILNELGADNPAFSEDSMKAVYVTVNALPYTESTITAGKIIFKALTDNGGKFRLSDRITTIGYDTSILLSHKTDLTDIGLFEKASVLDINVQDVIIK